MLAGSWVLLLSALAACGGRAMFDQGDASGGGPSAAGAKNGTAGGPSAGGNTGASKATDAACSKYCSAQAQQVCSFETDAQCPLSCSEELGRQTPDCQKNAWLMLDCLVAAYQSSTDCNRAEQFARDQCAALITNYQACAGGQPDPPPTAQPPHPTPRPPIPVGCSGTGSGSAFGCSVSIKCGDRSYHDIFCKQNADGTSTCVCGSSSFILDESVQTACQSGVGKCEVR